MPFAASRVFSCIAAGSIAGLMASSMARRDSCSVSKDSQVQATNDGLSKDPTPITAQTKKVSSKTEDEKNSNVASEKKVAASQKENSKAMATPKVMAGHRRPDLPDISLDTIRKHNAAWLPDKPLSENELKEDDERDDADTDYSDDDAAEISEDKRVYVTYKNGVYDVTHFLNTHPGGRKRLLLAAGGSIERYWDQFTLHNDDAVRKMLESMRIGNVQGYSDEDAHKERENSKRKEDQRWEKEPQRDEKLDVLSNRPFNAQAPADAFKTFFTPNNLFFVRSHMPVPSLSVSSKDSQQKDKDNSFCLQVEGKGLSTHCFTLDELHKLFKSHTVPVTIECGGNRRSEMAPVAESQGKAPTKGLQWTNGGISTAEWKGFLLKDIIDHCRMSPDEDTKTKASKDNGEESSSETIKHIHFQGADADAAGRFAVSVPYSMAMAPDREAIVAFEMNNQPIPRDHGYPLRAIIPGTVGVRNCKWLTKVSVVEGKEANTVWQQQDYKNFPSYSEKPDPSLPSVYAMPVQSAITEVIYRPSASTGQDKNKKVEAPNNLITTNVSGAVDIKGYAYTGTGAGIQRVEISCDGGHTFVKSASLYKGDHRPEGSEPAEQQNAIKNVSADSTLSPQTGRGKDWTWSLFSATVDLSSLKCKKDKSKNLQSSSTHQSENEMRQPSTQDGDKGGSCWKICTRAVANDNAAQPPEGDYNFRGLLYNGYSCKEVCEPS